jgi:hypothetical protein
MDGWSDVSGKPPAPRARSGSILLRLLMLSLLLPVLAACNPFDRGFKWHQRLVLEVETPDGVVSGGSVVAVHVWKSRVPGQAGIGMGSDVSGEASFVEVAPGRYLFALIGSSSPRELAFRLFFPEPAPDTFERAALLEDMQGETRVVPPERYPLLVTFADIDDPASVRQVDPHDLEAAFGPGVTLRRVTLEVTDDPETEGTVENVLDWLSEYPEPALCPVVDPLNPPFCRRIKHGNFRRD